MANWSKDAITWSLAKESGEYLGSYITRKQGFGPEFWTIDVFDINDQLYGGDFYEGMVEPMIQGEKENIIKCLKKRNIND
jgi:hypothetical protein